MRVRWAQTTQEYGRHEPIGKSRMSATVEESKTDEIYSLSTLSPVGRARENTRNLLSLFCCSVGTYTMSR